MAAKLHKDSRASMAFERATRTDTVTVLLAVEVDRLEDVRGRVSQGDGEVVCRLDEIGFVRAVVPIEHVDELVADDAVDTASVMFTHDFTSVSLVS